MPAHAGLSGQLRFYKNTAILQPPKSHPSGIFHERGLRVTIESLKFTP